MPAARPPRTPALVRHKPTGQARVRIAGRDFYLGRHGTPEAEAAYHRLLAEWRETGVVPPAARTARSPARPAGPTVDEVVLAFWRFAEGYYRDEDGNPTAELPLYKSALRVLRRVAGPDPAGDFGPRRLLAVQAAMVDAGWTRKYVNRSVGRVRRVFKWAVSREMIPVEIYQALRTVDPLLAGRTAAPEGGTRRAVPADDLRAVKAVLCDRHRDVLDLLVLTGARPSELLGLTTAGIDRSGEVWVAKLARHKNAHRGKFRALVFGPRGREILENHLKPEEPDARIFALRRDTFSQAVKRACVKAGVTPFTPYALRHTCGYRTRAEAGLDVTQQLLGHANAEQTEHYAPPDLAAALAYARDRG